jgi:predicted amidohydrolase
MPWMPHLKVLAANLRQRANAVEQFVDVWCFVDRHCSALENVMAPAGAYALSAASNVPQALSQLDSAVAGEDRLASATSVLTLMSVLDESLAALPVSAVLATAPCAVDETSYSVLPVRDFPLVNRNRASARTRRGSVDCYAARHVPIPLDANVAISGELLDGTALGSRLFQARSIGRVVCHPLGHDLEVVLHGQSAQVRVVNQSLATAQLTSALANSGPATILVLPELSLPPGALEGPGGQRIAHASPYPVLTVAGIHHDASSGTWRNEAIVVDRHGSVVYRHQKLTRVDQPGGPWEIHETGSHLGLLPSPLAALAVMICKDLFDPGWLEVVADAGANLLLVPSLSNKTDDHLVAAHHLRQRSLTTTFVTNRWGIGGTAIHPEAGRSFALVPGARLAHSGTELEQLAKGVPIVVDWHT